MYNFEALLKRECICEIWRFAQDLCEASLNNKASSNGKKGRIFTQHYDSTYSISIFWGSSRDEPSAQCIGPLELGAPRTRETTSSVMPRKKSVKSWGVWIFCSSSSASSCRGLAAVLPQRRWARRDALCTITIMIYSACCELATMHST